MNASYKLSYHDISALGIDHLLCTILPQHAGRGQQRDLTIFDSNVVAGSIRGGYHEAIDDEKVKAVHVLGAAGRQQACRYSLDVSIV